LAAASPLISTLAGAGSAQSLIASSRVISLRHCGFAEGCA